MNNSRTRSTRAILCAGILSLGLTAQATTITGWTYPTTSGMNYSGGALSTWAIPTYNNQVKISSHITTDTTWTADKTYILDGPIYVKDGATLTIEPGTVIRGMPWRDSTTSRPGTLAVLKNAFINARGTASAPIIFTDMWDNNVPGMTAGPVQGTNGGGTPSTYGWPNGQYRDYSRWEPTFGYWGGVIIVGNCPVAAYGALNNVVQTTTALYVEGVDTSADVQYGNGDLNDDDNSGVFAYVSIRYGGYPLAGTSEVNGLSLYAVGRGTEIHHIEVINSIDDGFEWFGGTVNTKYLSVWCYGDDGFDSDQGYRGMCQFAFAVQGACADVVNKESSGYLSVVGSAWADKGMEIDGSDKSDDFFQPLAKSQWFNLTLVGKGSDHTGLTEVTGSESADQWLANTAVLCRDNSAPQIYNSIFLDFAGSVIAIERRDDKTSGGYGYDCYSRAQTAYDNLPVNNSVDFPNESLYQVQTPGYQLELANSVVYGFGGTLYPTTAQALLVAAGTENSGTDTLKKHLDLKNAAGGSVSTGEWTTNANFAAAYYHNVTAGELPILSLSRDMNTASFRTAKQVFAVTNINPCVKASFATSARTAPNNGFYTPVSYPGAFSPTYNWLKGWTLVDKLGLTDTSSNSGGTGVDVTELNMTPVIQFPTVAGKTYRIEETPSLSSNDWTVAETVVGNGATMTYADVSGRSANYFRVIAED